jgi:hypothetical protein
MKTFVTATIGMVAMSTVVFAQETRVPRPGIEGPSSGATGSQQLNVPNPRATTGQAPTTVPGAGDPYGAKGGGVGLEPNPDRIPHPGN